MTTPVPRWREQLRAAALLRRLDRSQEPSERLAGEGSAFVTARATLRWEAMQEAQALGLLPPPLRPGPVTQFKWRRAERRWEEEGR